MSGISDEECSLEGDQKLKSSTSSRVDNHVNDCKFNYKQPFSHEMRAPDLSHDTLTLPKIEIDRFGGSPIMFWKFMKGFQSMVANRLRDENQKLMYLLHYTCGKAKEAIEHCVLLPPASGCAKAMGILEKRFGRPHDVAETFINELIYGASIRADDTDALSVLIQRLPRYLQMKWSEVAEDILCEGSEPSFNQLVTFLEKCLSAATNIYGQVARSSKGVSSRKVESKHYQPSIGRLQINAVAHSYIVKL